MLVLETGFIVDNANTYITRNQCNAILYDYGYDELPAGQEEAFIKQAARYVDSYRTRFVGIKSTSSQSMQWPRNNVVIDKYPVESTTIPECIKIAQALVANELRDGNTLYGENADGRMIKSESVDVISVSYDTGGITAPSPFFGEVMAQLSVVLKQSAVNVCRI